MSENNMYEIGQVLYIIPEGKTSIVPLRVVEVVTKKTLKEDNVTCFIVRYDKDEKKVCDVNSLKGKVYKSINDVKADLVRNASEAIDHIADKAVENANAWYDLRTSSKPSPPEENDDMFAIESLEETPNNTENVKKVKLPGGEIVNVKF